APRGSAGASGLALPSTATGTTPIYARALHAALPIWAIALSAGAAASIGHNAGGASAPAGTAVTPPPSVIVKDASGNPVSGVAVTFAVAPGNGTVTPTTPVSTGTDGIAAATSWTLSPTAGPQTPTATASGLTGSPVPFTATGTAGAATRLVITRPPSSTAQSGAPLAQQPAVQLQDANGNPVSQGGVVVTATPSPAGATASNNTATTEPSGSATFSGLTLTGTAGSYTLSFGGTGITPVSSGAIALSAGAAVSIAHNAGGTSAPAGTAVTPPPSVIVKDASGNPVSGVAVTFAANPGSGTVTPTTPVNTSADGIAAATSWTLSPTAGTNTLTATASGLAGSPGTFTATGTAGAATRLVLTTPPSATAQSGAPLVQQPVVQLQDANGNSVSQGGVVVTATP